MQAKRVSNEQERDLVAQEIFQALQTWENVDTEVEVDSDSVFCLQNKEQVQQVRWFIRRGLRVFFFSRTALLSKMEPPKHVDVPTEERAEPSEKALKKLAAKQEKEAKKAERAATLAAQQQAAAAALNKEVTSIEEDSYGYYPLCRSTTRTQRVWTPVPGVDCSLCDQQVWVRGRIQESRNKGSLGFLVLREKFNTLQVVFAGNKEALKFATSLPLESIVDIFGNLVDPGCEILGATQQVELHATKIFCVSKACQELPFQMKDANRPEAEELTEGAIRVAQDTRLDNRVLDLRTLSMQAVLRVASQTCTLFREALLKRGFTEIHTPKLIGGTSEGGTNVFRLKYFGRDACMAQSPQLHKQMAICSDMERVFEIGPVFRAENSNTHRHLCEFTGMDFEMAFKEHYFEALEVAEGMFLDIFKGLEERCAAEIACVHKQYPAEPFKAGDPSKPVLRLDFAEGCAMLRAANVGDVPEDISQFDINTEQEKALGRLVREKYDTDFYYMINYPLAVRPFYTMPAPQDPKLSNSYDFFMRGEEIVSGAQRIHDPGMLTERAQACGIDVATLRDYIGSFELAAPPHAGIGVGMERVVMLFLGLPNIRKVSMFPRDPKRLAP